MQQSREPCRCSLALPCYPVPVASAPGIRSVHCTAALCRTDVAFYCVAADQSKKQRDALSLRSARPGDRKVTFRKPNAATKGLMLGLKFRESFGKAVYIDQIVPGTEAARLEREGKIKKGDEVTMVSATFGDEMWSARNVGKYRLEKSIAVRQGMTISFVFENSDDQSKAARKERPPLRTMTGVVLG